MRTPLATFVIFSLCFVSSTIAAAQDKWPCIRVGEGEAASRIYAALDTIVDVNFQEAPLRDVIDALASKAQIPIILDEKALTESGIGTDTPVSIEAKQISFKAALKIFLGNLDLMFLVRDEVLQITTPDFAWRRQSTCLFNIAEIADSPEKIEQLTKILERKLSRPDSKRSSSLASFGNVLILVGNYYDQDEVAEFLAALHKAQATVAEAPKTP